MISNNIKKRIIVFTKLPEPGTCKTRLISVLSSLNSAHLQKKMTSHIINISENYCKKDSSCELEIRFFGKCDKNMPDLWKNHFYREQSGKNLGDKMFQAISQALSEGTEQVILTGSDCIDISAELIEQAFNLLAKNDVVAGPALDGGYYIIGVKKSIKKLFPPDMPWGSNSVLKKTLKIVNKLSLKHALLKKLSDVDTPSDLSRFCHTSFFKDMPLPIISVIIPTLNEETNIADTIKSITAPSVEIIVCDGGSTDATRKIAKKHGAIVVESERGRGFQQNKGTAIAKAAILLFLHADTLLPKNFLKEVFKILSTSGTSAGAFRLKISGSNQALNIVQFFTNLRSIFFQLPYGDQAIFVKKNLFQKVGGFPDITIMEDYVLVRKLKKHGRILISPCSVITSGRRWDTIGYLKTLIINQLMIISYHMNVKIERLENLYKKF